MSERVNSDSVITTTSIVLDQIETDQTLADEVSEIDDQRWSRIEDLRLLRAINPCLPELPDSQASGVYERVVEYERLLAAPNLSANDYGDGTAPEEQDDALYITGNGIVLAEAQHATDPVRKSSGKREKADHGTAGLSAVLAADGHVRAIIPIGRQLGNANVNHDHPIKRAITTELSRRAYKGFLSVHGMLPGKVTDLRDETEIHAVIGLGMRPDDVSRQAADEIIAQAKEHYGLRVIIGNDTPHMNFQKDARHKGTAFRDRSATIEQDDNGLPILSKLAAASATSTTTFVSTHPGREAGSAALQLEMSRSLRLIPADLWQRLDATAERTAVYLGYELGRIAAKVCQSYNG